MESEDTPLNVCRCRFDSCSID